MIEKKYKRFIEIAYSDTLKCWWLRVTENAFDDKCKHMTFTVEPTHCPFCGKDLAIELRQYYMKELLQEIKNKVILGEIKHKW